MREMIDKKRTEAKVFLIARFFIDRPDREVELVKSVIHRCCEEIDKQPTIEAEPVRYGRWIQRRNGEYYCADCGREEKFIFQKNFCPGCGAQMDGGADN